MVESEIESLQKSLRIYRGLVEVSSLINSITEFDELLQAILSVARRVIRAEASSLFLTREVSGDLEMVMASRADDEFYRPNISVPRGQGIAGWVLENERSALIADAYDDPRFFRDADAKSGFRTRSMICTPLVQDGRVIGVIQVLNALDTDAFDQGDLEAFEAYANLIATAIDKLRAIDQMRAQERVRRDVQIASEIQQELLSRAIPESLDGYHFASHYQAAQNVGGDFFLVFPREDGSVYFAIGDVSGKGISASLLMAQTLSAMQFVFASASSPSDALRVLNRNTESQVVRGMFVTALVGRMNREKNAVSFASAGHCRPWILRSAGGCEEIQTAGALPLGILPDVEYPQVEAALHPGDCWVTFTDGLTESRCPVTGDFFEDRLRGIFESTTVNPGVLIERLIFTEEAFRDGSPARDDLTMLAGGIQ